MELWTGECDAVRQGLQLQADKNQNFFMLGADVLNRQPKSAQFGWF